MVLAKAFDEALSAPRTTEGPVTAEHGGQKAEAEVVDVDRLGATIDRLRLSQAKAGDVRRQVEAMPPRLKALGEPLQPNEVEPALGGAVLRSEPDPTNQNRYWEVNIRNGREASLDRYRVERETGERQREPFTLTREQLGRVVEGMSDALGEGTKRG
jgi:hypothetical protein